MPLQDKPQSHELNAWVAGILSQIVHKARLCAHKAGGVPQGHWCYLRLATNVLARRKNPVSVTIALMLCAIVFLIKKQPLAHF